MFQRNTENCLIVCKMLPKTAPLLHNCLVQTIIANKVFFHQTFSLVSRNFLASNPLCLSLNYTITDDLAKARVMTDGKLLKENLMNIDVNCNLASQNLQVFYANNDGMHNLMSYINQLGDYCVFLIKQFVVYPHCFHIFKANGLTILFCNLFALFSCQSWFSDLRQGNIPRQQ